MKYNQPSATKDAITRGALPPVIADLEVTTELAPLGYKIPQSLEEMFAMGGSRVGHSAVASFLSCPEKARLRALGVRRRSGKREPGVPWVLNDLEYGTLIHNLLAIRVVYGHETCKQYLEWLPELSAETRMKAYHAIQMYDATWPLAHENFEYLGIEPEVVADFGDGRGHKLLRTVRYDAIVRQDRDIFSLERKTASRSGEGTVAPYTPQFMVQAAIWNANEALTTRYGFMRGVIADVITKAEVPKCERYGPRYISPQQERLAIEYMRLPEAVKFPVNADGSYPRMLHTCWGRFRPCDYIGLCHEGSIGDYEIPGLEEAEAEAAIA